jgi:DNA-binding response OmpR family regulator
MRKILIIEDEKTLRDTLSDILEISGYSVVQAKDGEDGVEAFAKTDPDLIICDIHMPKMDGFAVLKMLRALTPASKFPPFFFISAKAEPENIRKGMNLGATDFVTKPYDTRELLNTIKLQIENRKKLELAIIKDERARIAQDLHESLENLVAAQAEIQKAVDRFDEGPKEKQYLLTKSEELLKQVMSEIRSLSPRLKPDLIKTYELENYLKTILNPVDSFSGGKLDLSINIEGELLQHQLQILMCLMVHEMMSNTLNHAKAKTISIQVIRTKNDTQLDFQDDGIGFNTNEHTEGKGLLKLRKKVAELNGELTLESEPNKGTRIHLSIKNDY